MFFWDTVYLKLSLQYTTKYIITTLLNNSEGK